MNIAYYRDFKFFKIILRDITRVIDLLQQI